jgi:O-antigen/teichoic acid export membrane protein
MLKRLGLNFSAQFLSLALSFADRFIVVGLLLRTLGADSYADWILLLSSAGLLSLAEMGLNIYYGNVWQIAFVQGDSRRFQRQLGFALTVSLFLGAALGLVALGMAFFLDLQNVLSLKTVTSSSADIVFLFLGAAVISRAMRGAISQLYRGRQLFALGTAIDQVFPAMLVVALATSALFGGSLVHLSLVYLISDLLAGWGIMLSDLRRRFPELSFRPEWPTELEMRELGRHIRWFAIQQGAPLVWLQLPILLLGWNGVQGQAIVSFLIIRTLVNFARQISSMLAISAGVELATSFHSGQQAQFLRHLGAISAALSGLAGAMAAAICVFGETFVGIWTGYAGLFNIHIMAWLLGGAVISAPMVPLASASMLCNIPKAGAIANLVQIVVGIGSVLALIPFFGNVGAAAGLAIGEVVGLGFVLPWVASRPLGVFLPTYLLRCIGMILFCFGWSWLVAMMTNNIISPQGLGGMISAGAVWGTIGFLPAMLATLPFSQKQELLRLMKRLRLATSTRL